MRKFFKYNIRGVWVEESIDEVVVAKIFDQYLAHIRLLIVDVDKKFDDRPELKPAILQALITPLHYYEENIVRNIIEKKNSQK